MGVTKKITNNNEMILSTCFDETWSILKAVHYDTRSMFIDGPEVLSPVDRTPVDSISVVRRAAYRSISILCSESSPAFPTTRSFKDRKTSRSSTPWSTFSWLDQPKPWHRPFIHWLLIIHQNRPIAAAGIFRFELGRWNGSTMVVSCIYY